MNPSRLEAFSDGVLAIIITIMVLELKPPEGPSVYDFIPLIPNFLFYILSFIYIGIYWNNHHHLFKATKIINGKILWANLALLFFLSLIPFTTFWMGNFTLENNPVALYGINLFFCAVSFILIEKLVLEANKGNSSVSTALENQKKEKISLGSYGIGIILSFIYTPLALFCYAFVAFIWLIPDKRLEEIL